MPVATHRRKAAMSPSDVKELQKYGTVSRQIGSVFHVSLDLERRVVSQLVHELWNPAYSDHPHISLGDNGTGRRVLPQKIPDKREPRGTLRVMRQGK